MLRKYLLVLTMLLALPALAHAWSVNAKSSSAAQGTISPAGNASYAIGENSGEYTVTPAAGCSVSRVTLDGVAILPNAGGKYVAPYVVGKSWRYLVAYFKTNTVGITTSAGAGGVIREDNYESLSNIPLGASRQLQIIPNPGYTVASVTALGATVTGDAQGQLAVFTNLQGSKSVSASFTLIPVRTVDAGNAVRTTGNGAAHTATLRGSATSNMGPITYVWSGPPELVFVPTPAPTHVGALPNGPGTIDVYSTTAGTYTATLTATSGGGSVTDTVQVVVPDTTQVQVSSCASCHSSSAGALVTGYQASGHPVAGVSCQGCHSDQPHTGASRSGVCATCHSGTIHGFAALDCAACHNPHSLAATAPAEHPAAIVAEPSSTNCAACHDPAPHYGGTAFHKAQYVSAASLPTSCADCHGEPANTTANQAILVQYAVSAHGDPAGEAWIHYDWRSGNRSSCARCHTGTAFVAKLGIENDTSYVFQPGDILKPGEALTCSACHTEAGAGALRTAAQEFTINMRNGATVTYDVAGASTLCARCHSGRETGQSIKADTDANGVRVFVDSHYQPAAGTLYNKAGYEYAGQDYDLGSHKLLGAASQGPCVTCHMPGKDHSLVAASCGTCHGVTAPVVNASNLKADYDAALNDLKLALEAKGIHYGPAHPFFFTAPYVAGGTNAPVTNWGSAYGAGSWQDTMGAAFNYNLLWSEKGAFAHNYGYAMKLIADSIDFMSDGVVDGQ